MKHQNEIKTDELVERIRSIERNEMDSVIFALMKRRKELYSDTELVLLSIPKYDRAERNRLWTGLLDYLRNVEHMELPE